MVLLDIRWKWFPILWLLTYQTVAIPTTEHLLRGSQYRWAASEPFRQQIRRTTTGSLHAHRESSDPVSKQKSDTSTPDPSTVFTESPDDPEFTHLFVTTGYIFPEDAPFEELTRGHAWRYANDSSNDVWDSEAMKKYNITIVPLTIGYNLDGSTRIIEGRGLKEVSISIGLGWDKFWNWITGWRLSHFRGERPQQLSELALKAPEVKVVEVDKFIPVEVEKVKWRTRTRYRTFTKVIHTPRGAARVSSAASEFQAASGEKPLPVDRIPYSTGDTGGWVGGEPPIDPGYLADTEGAKEIPIRSTQPDQQRVYESRQKLQRSSYKHGKQVEHLTQKRVTNQQAVESSKNNLAQKSVESETAKANVEEAKVELKKAEAQPKKPTLMERLRADAQTRTREAAQANAARTQAEQEHTAQLENQRQLNEANSNMEMSSEELGRQGETVREAQGLLDSGNTEQANRRVDVAQEQGQRAARYEDAATQTMDEVSTREQARTQQHTNTQTESHGGDGKPTEDGKPKEGTDEETKKQEEEKQRKEKAEKEATDKKAAEEQAEKEAADKKAAEEKVEQEKADKKAAEEQAEKEAADKKAAEEKVEREKADKEVADKKTAEDQAEMQKAENEKIEKEKIEKEQTKKAPNEKAPSEKAPSEKAPTSSPEDLAEAERTVSRSGQLESEIERMQGIMARADADNEAARMRLPETEREVANLDAEHKRVTKEWRQRPDAEKVKTIGEKRAAYDRWEEAKARLLNDQQKVNNHEHLKSINQRNLDNLHTEKANVKSRLVEIHPDAVRSVTDAHAASATRLSGKIEAIEGVLRENVNSHNELTRLLMNEVHPQADPIRAAIREGRPLTPSETQTWQRLVQQESDAFEKLRHLETDFRGSQIERTGLRAELYKSDPAAALKFQEGNYWPKDAAESLFSRPGELESLDVSITDNLSHHVSNTGPLVRPDSPMMVHDGDPNHFSELKVTKGQEAWKKLHPEADISKPKSGFGYDGAHDLDVLRHKQAAQQRLSFGDIWNPDAHYIKTYETPEATFLKTAEGKFFSSPRAGAANSFARVFRLAEAIPAGAVELTTGARVMVVTARVTAAVARGLAAAGVILLPIAEVALGVMTGIMIAMQVASVVQQLAAGNYGEAAFEMWEAIELLSDPSSGWAMIMTIFHVGVLLVNKIKNKVQEHKCHDNLNEEYKTEFAKICHHRPEHVPTRKKMWSVAAFNCNLRTKDDYKHAPGKLLDNKGWDSLPQMPQFAPTHPMHHGPKPCES